MVRKFVIAGLALVFFLIAFTLTWVSLSQASLSPSKTTIEACKTVNNAGLNKPAIVFFGSDKEAKAYANYLFTVKPFDEIKNELNVFTINYHPPCTLYNDIALYCYSKDIIEKAASCPGVKYIVALEDRPRAIRSSAYMQVASINTALPKSVVAHELGHVIAHFAEEYDAGISPPFNSNNCQGTCTQFSGKTDGCFTECSDTDHMRSIETGIMRSLSATTFGTFDEEILREKLKAVQVSKPTGNVIFDEACIDKQYWLVETEFKEGSFFVKNQELKTGCAPELTSGDFTYTLSSKGKELFSDQFNPITLFTDGDSGKEEIDGETVQLEDATTYITFTTETHADSITIRDGQQTERGHASLAEISNAACKVI